jgi:hypothetical protein
MRGREVLRLRPGQRSAVLAPHRGTGRQMDREVRGVKRVPGQRLAQVQAIVVPEVSTQRPAIPGQEVRKA